MEDQNKFCGTSVSTNYLNPNLFLTKFRIKVDR